MSSRNESAELRSVQLQLELRTLSTAGAAWEELYWRFLDNALRRRLNSFGFEELSLFPFDPVAPPPRFRPHEFYVPTIFRPRPNGFRQPHRPHDHYSPWHQRGAVTMLPADPNNRCILCFDDIDLDSITKIPCGIACPRSHVIHRQCLDNLIVNHCETVLHTPSTPSHIRCPACTAHRSGNPFGFFNNSELVQVDTYSDHQLRHACGGASQQALDLLESVAQADRKLAALPEDEQITNGNTDCYLCPKCKFGPVAHQSCDDLRSHHAQGGISNKCPKCGFLGSSITEWIRIAEPRAPTFAPGLFLPSRFGERWEWDIPHIHFPPREVYMPQGTPYVTAIERPPFPESEGFGGFDFSNFERLRDSTDMEWSHAPFWSHEPSYWDAVMRRLIRASLQAAAESSTTVAAITNGSAAADAVASSDSSCLSEEIASAQSLVITHESARAVDE